jgi:hypothetical protein
VYEHGAAWTITGPDGTTVTFNTAGSPFYLEAISGFDGPNVRTSVEDRPEYDGAVAGNFYFGSRPVTLSGRIIAASATERNQAVVSLQRALRALRSDLTVKSTSSGLDPMQVTGRLANPPRITGGYVKEFQIGLICPDPRIYSQTLHSLTSSAAAGSVTGVPWPIVWPANWGGGSGAAAIVSVVNAGNIETPPILRVYGIITNPEVRNNTTGASIYLDNLTLAGGEYVDIDVSARTAVTGTGVNVYAKVRFPASDWWLVSPGTNDLELRATSTGAGVQLTVYWRDAWA